MQNIKYKRLFVRTNTGQDFKTHSNLIVNYNMAIICCKCNTDIDENDNYFECDSCRRPIHANYACSELSASEIKCMQLKKRILRFLCTDCNKGLLLIPSLVRSIEELKVDIENLKLKCINTSNANSGQPLKVNEIAPEEIISEMLERQKRANNIMIANLNEPNSNTEDLTSVKSLLKEINVDVDDIKVTRIGKPNKQRPRLLKVILKNPEDAITVLKSKRNIKETNIKIFQDQTKRQIQYYKDIKNELQRLIDNGDNTKTIRYINNKPTIVTKMAQKN